METVSGTALLKYNKMENLFDVLEAEPYDVVIMDGMVVEYA